MSRRLEAQTEAIRTIMPVLIHHLYRVHANIEVLIDTYAPSTQRTGDRSRSPNALIDGFQDACY
jgi:hypothetical protein